MLTTYGHICLCPLTYPNKKPEHLPNGQWISQFRMRTWEQMHLVYLPRLSNYKMLDTKFGQENPRSFWEGVENVQMLNDGQCTKADENNCNRSPESLLSLINKVWTEWLTNQNKDPPKPSFTSKSLITYCHFLL